MSDLFVVELDYVLLVLADWLQVLALYVLFKLFFVRDLSSKISPSSPDILDNLLPILNDPCLRRDYLLEDLKGLFNLE